MEKHGDLELICSSDDEGNNYNEVMYSPAIGIFFDKEFTPLDDSDKNILAKPTHACIN